MLCIEIMCCRIAADNVSTFLKIDISLILIMGDLSPSLSSWTNQLSKKICKWYDVVHSEINHDYYIKTVHRSATMAHKYLQN